MAPTAFRELREGPFVVDLKTGILIKRKGPSSTTVRGKSAGKMKSSIGSLKRKRQKGGR
jgi:hypothetical protein